MSSAGTKTQEDNAQLQETHDSFSPLIAGVTAGAASTALLLPLDNIKVRMQVHEIEKKGKESSTSKSANRLGAVRVLRGVIRHEGVAGLYQGLTPAVVGSSLSWGGFFFIYEGLKKHLKNKRRNHQCIPHHTTKKILCLYPRFAVFGAVCAVSSTERTESLLRPWP